MPQVVFVLHDGTRQTVEATEARSLMDAAVKAGVPGILAECGGACACATCHVQIGGNWQELLVAPSALETSMMEFLDEVQATSRLACQIAVTAQMAGMEVVVPQGEGF